MSTCSTTARPRASAPLQVISCSATITPDLRRQVSKLIGAEGKRAAGVALSLADEGASAAGCSESTRASRERAHHSAACRTTLGATCTLSRGARACPAAAAHALPWPAEAGAI